MENETGIENEDGMLSNSDQIHRVYDILFDAIPNDVCSFNVLVAINQLSLDWALGLHEEYHGTDDEDDDISDVGNLPGTSFSKN